VEHLFLAKTGKKWYFHVEKDEIMNHEILEARYSDEQLIQKYNRIACVYDLFGILMESKARQLALDLASIRNGERILEVALGTGLNFVELVRRNPKGWVGGVDVSIKMLERARKRVSKTGRKNFTLHLSDSRQLPFRDRSFDIVITQYLFDILPVDNFTPILLEFKRVLKNGGRVVVVNMTKSEKWVNQIYEGIYKLKPPLLAGCRGVLARPFLEKAGFKEIRREFVSQLGFPSEVVRGIKK
jgi:ubiquinone/menaquinone biosynthesis C-methylase UbiE